MSNFEERFNCGPPITSTSSYSDKYYAALAELGRLAVAIETAAAYVEEISPIMAVHLRLFGKKVADIESPEGILNYVTAIGKKELERLHKELINARGDTRLRVVPNPAGFGESPADALVLRHVTSEGPAS